MTRNPNDAKGLNSGRTWTAVPAPGCPAGWTLDSNREFLKGPLALAEFRGHRISFFLEDGQFGFLAQDVLREAAATRQGDFPLISPFSFLPPLLY